MTRRRDRNRMVPELAGLEPRKLMDAGDASAPDPATYAEYYLQYGATGALEGGGNAAYGSLYDPTYGLADKPLPTSYDPADPNGVPYTGAIPGPSPDPAMGAYDPALVIDPATGQSVLDPAVTGAVVGPDPAMGAYDPAMGDYNPNPAP